MGAIAAAITAIGALASGVGSVMAASAKGPKASDPPPTPTQEDAVAKAKEADAKRRRASLISGGTTVLTSPEGATLAGAAGEKKQLLGQ